MSLNTVLLGALLVVAGAGVGYVAGDAGDSTVEIGPNQTVVDRSEALSEKNGLTAAEAGPEGTLTFESCDGDECTIDVQVDSFNNFRMLYVSLYSNGSEIESEYLHPGNTHFRVENATTEASLALAVPVRDDTGYWWRESYSLRMQADHNPDRTEHEFEALVVYSIINEDYFFGEIPDEDEKDSDTTEKSDE